MVSRTGASSGADSVGSRTGAGSRTGVDCMVSRTGASSGEDSVGSRTRADCMGSRNGVDCVGSRNGAGSGADSVGSRNRADCMGLRNGAGSVGSRNGLWSRLCGLLERRGLRNSLQELPKFPKRQVFQPPHSPPVEGLLKGTIEEVLEGRIIVPQALGCPTEPQGKLPYVSTLLT